MSQHDFDIDNATAAAARVDINLALKALGSLSSGTTAPATTYANMLWYETDTNWLWVRNEADSAWIRFAYLDQTTNQIALVDNTNVVNTSGTQVGLLGDQTTATWQAGTGTTQSLVSPANVKAAILALQSVYTLPTSAGAAETYAFLRADTDSSSISAGSTVSGSTMRYSNANFDKSGTPSGTWRCMGYSPNRSFPTTYLRIS